MDTRAIEFILSDQLTSLRWTLALAESCTGGLLCHRITNVPGSSNYFSGGIVAYSNAAKKRLLGVSEETLNHYGAVSQQTVIAMAQGAQKLFESQAAISVSGIAGPGGGTLHKPVGTVWMGIAILDTVHAFLYRFHGDRGQIKQQSAEMALWLLAQRLTEEWQDEAISRQINAQPPLAVEFSGDQLSSMRIQAIYWGEKWIAIESVGRRWEDAQGKHFLVMSYAGKVYEIIQRADGCWFIRPPMEQLKHA